MDKKPPIPPRHRHYPRARPTPLRPVPAPLPGRQDGAAIASVWPRSVPEGRTFPRS